MDNTQQSSVEIAQKIDAARQGHSWWKACCAGCGTFIILGFIIIIFLFRYMFGLSVEIRKDVPPNFPKDVSIYAPEKVVSVTYASGAQKSRIMQALSKPASVIDRVINTNNKDNETKQVIEFYGSAMSTNDSVTISWSKIDVKPQEVVSFYQNELRSRGFNFNESTSENHLIEFTASRPEVAVQGIITSTVDEKQVNDMILTIVYDTQQDAVEKK
ncbi:hypothetical protein IT408_02805 [Candidatus Uhrbacteria bacterium]|nr:hypothetical protein [Candidatus Uhrbacteria bacterium]